MDERCRVAAVGPKGALRGLLGRPVGMASAGRVLGVLVGVLLVAGVFAASAFANAPNPTSIHVDGYSVKGSEVEITISGTWTWNVPNGAQQDCNDSRIGVGYSVAWGDNTTNALKVHGNNETIYVGTATDDWVHSVTAGNQIVDGPFHPKGGKGNEETLVEESMLGETPEGMLFGYGYQGISTGANSAIPTEENAHHWVSNCGPTKQSVVNGQTIGNSNPGEPEKGYPNGTWGPISHVYKTAGPYTICPVMYDPHGHEVGEAASNAKEITAGANSTTNNYNGDNSVESNGNTTPCVQQLTVPKLTTKSSPSSGITGQALKDEASIEGNNPQGSIAWSLYGPFKSGAEIKETSCTGVPVFESSAVSVNGNGTYSSPTTTVSTAGVYQWVASYTSSDNSTNLSVGPIGCGETAEQANITPAPKPEFTIEKLQKISGEFTKSEVTGKLGETVHYELVVTNTGNVALKLNALVDGKCTNIAPAGATELAVGGKETFTCEHVLTAVGKYTNAGTIETTEHLSHESNEVVVNVPAEPAFTIEKLQKISGEFTKSEVTGKLGETVHYELVVTNTGNVALKLNALVDGKCTNIAPAGATELAVGGKETFTCEHVLTAVGKYTNAGTIETTEHLSHESNEVVVNVPAEPAFTIEKLQKISGEFTKSEVTGKLGETVHYELVVTNTGNVALKLNALVDGKCTNIAPAGATELAVGGKETFTCEHVLTAVGKYTNAGTIETTEHLSHESNEVVVNVPAEPAFTIEKLQKISGEFTKSEVTGKLGETVHYELVVTNTGNVALKLNALVDGKCTNIAPAGATELAVGGKETFTCEHVLTAVGKYTNAGTIETTEHLSHESNEVVVFVPREAFQVIKKQRFVGGGEFTTGVLRSAKIPNTVEYEILVKNTGETTLKVEKISDSECTTAPKGPAKPELAPGEEAVEYTCSRELTAAGTYTNVALVTGNEKEEPSNKVEVKLEKEGLEVIKKQRFAGEANYTEAKLSSTKIPNTVEYEILVKNVGETTLKVEKISDNECTTAPKGPAKPELAPGEEAVEYTCSRELTAAGTYTNVATVTGNEKEEPSNKVEVKLEKEGFQVIKKQRFIGGGEFTTGTLTSTKIPNTVEYEIIVKNTGETKLKVEKISDGECTTPPKGPEVPELAPGQEAVEYTCSRELTAAGTYTNVALVTGNEKEEPSNKVETKLEKEGFQVIKKQRFAGEASYTEAKLTSTKIPNTVEYEIIVKNTGETKLKVERLSDSECTTTPVGPQSPELAPGAEAVEYTCSRELTAAGTYTNVALVKANEKEEPSNKVEVKLEKQSYEIVKEQKLGGQPEADYTTSEIKGAKIGEVVDYKITVTNTGEAPESFTDFTDSLCANLNGGPTGPLAAGQSASWTCERTLTASGVFENVATVKGNEEPHPSNKVVVEVPKIEPKAACAISEPSIVLHGASGSKRKTFTVRISSLGIKEITFYLDGKKLKRLTASQAKHGQFEVKVDPSKLSYGAHKVTVKTVMSDPVCANITRAGVFVHPKPPKVTPKFTG